MDDLLTCPICFHWFDGDISRERSPLVLDCGHTFCKSCLSNSPRCFTCDLFTVKKRPNIILQHIVDHWTSGGGELPPTLDSETEYCTDPESDPDAEYLEDASPPRYTIVRSPSPARYTIEILVKSMDGLSRPIRIDPSETMESTKERLEEATGYPPQRQRLIFAGRQLTDDKKTCSEYGIENGSTVHMILTLHGD